MRAIIICAVLLAGLPAHAEPGPIGRWLMNQPLTLWDIGMIRAAEKAEEAAKSVGTGLGQWIWGEAQYDWDNNEIEISMTVTRYRGVVSHDKCNHARRSFIALLGAWALSLKWPIGADKVAAAKRDLHARIGAWFSHHGFAKAERDEKLAEKLARIVFVEVNLHGTTDSITCRERIMVFDAPSKPIASATKQ